MDGKKLSQLEGAEFIGDNDLLYIVRNTVESGLESKKLTVNQLKMLLGGGLPDLVIEPDYNSLSPDNFYLWVQEKLYGPIPDVATCYTVNIVEPTMIPVPGMVTMFPTVGGCYTHVSGFNSFGDSTKTEALVYLAKNEPGALRYISYTSVPKLTTGPKGDQGDQGEPGIQGEPGVAATITYTSLNGNWATNYSDDFSAEKAHGVKNGMEYWKTHIPLYNVKFGTVPPIDLQLQGLPCDASGKLLPYTLHHQIVFGGSGNPPKALLLLMVHGTATQALDITTGVYSPLGFVNGSWHDPLYMLSYWY